MYLKMRKLFVNITRGIVILLSKLPLGFHYFMGRILSWLLKDVMRYRYGTVMINLARSFPEKKYRELEKIASDFYRHLGEIFVEAIWFGGCNYKRLYKSGLVTVTNPEVLNELFAAAPSMTVLYSHCGNWELLGGFLGYRTQTGEKVDLEEEQITVVYKQLTSKFSDEFFKRNRAAALEKVGTSCEIESSNILRYAIKHRKDKKIYIYIADQAPYKGTGKHPVGEFLHQPTNAMLGSVGLANKLGHSVVYLKMKRVARGNYEMTFVPVCENASEHAPEDLIRRYYDLLEMEINETPHNWLWSHKRWK